MSNNLGDLLLVYETLKTYLPEVNIFELVEVEHVLFYALKVAVHDIESQCRKVSVLKFIDAIIDAVWEDLNIGHWSQVPETKRKLFSISSFLKVLRILQEQIFEGNFSSEQIREAIKAADMGLLLGNSFREQLSKAASLLNGLLMKDAEVSLEFNLRKSFPEEDVEKKRLVPSVKCPSLEYFYKNFFHVKLPVKLSDCISHWPAFEKWSNLNYFVRIAGSRTIPIEIGSSYVQNDWGMKLVSLEDFIKNFILQKSDRTGYLAQHQLFDQIPELKNDILIPEYCYLSETQNDCSVDINAWFGPKGTVSPLHYDPKHNLLCQVFGSKRIILYDPSESEKLYPLETLMMTNTSQVDPENPDFTRFPKYQSSNSLECLLYPGEMLYIPPKWWHHVRSLDVSFSVSFWWE